MKELKMSISSMLEQAKNEPLNLGDMLVEFNKDEYGVITDEAKEFWLTIGETVIDGGWGVILINKYGLQKKVPIEDIGPESLFMKTGAAIMKMFHIEEDLPWMDISKVKREEAF